MTLIPILVTGETAWRFGYDDILTGFHSKPTVNKAVQHKDGGLEQALRTGELDVMVLASCESREAGARLDLTLCASIADMKQTRLD